MFATIREAECVPDMRGGLTTDLQISGTGRPYRFEVVPLMSLEAKGALSGTIPDLRARLTYLAVEQIA